MSLDPYERILTLRNSGKVEEALSELQGLLESTYVPREKAALMLNQVVCYEMLGRIEQARQRLREAVQVTSEPVELRLRFDFHDALLCVYERRHKEALGKFDRLLAEYGRLPNHADHRELYEDIQIRRGNTLAQLGHYEEARPVLEEALSFQLVEGERGEICYNLGACYYELGDMVRAKESFLAALENHARGYCLVRSRTYLGAIYFGEKAYSKALEEFQWCEPRIEEGILRRDYVYGWLAKTCRALGRDSEAKQYADLAASAKFPQ